MAVTNQLDALAKKVPGQSQQALKQQQEAQKVQLQQQLAQVPQGASATRAVQQMAPKATLQAGQTALAAQKQEQDTLKQVGQLGLQAQKSQTQQDVADRQLQVQKNIADKQRELGIEVTRSEIASRKKMTAADLASKKKLSDQGLYYDSSLQGATLKQREDLAKLGLDIKEKILDSRLAFELEDGKRKLANERQLADYAIASAKNQQELEKKAQVMQQVSHRKIKMMEILNNRLQTELEREAALGEQKLSQEHKKKLAQLIAENKRRMEREKADAANRAALFKTAGTILAAGAVAATGGGAAAVMFAGTAGGAAAPILAEGV